MPMHIVAHAIAMAIKTSADCYMFFKHIWKTKTLCVHERVYVAFLNAERVPICYKRINIGNYSYTLFDTETTISCALKTKCRSIVIAHNHTHGSPQPSEYDIEITYEIQKILNALSITLVDHIILSPEGYFSFRDEGLLKTKGSRQPTREMA